jgi:hypothetical protein
MTARSGGLAIPLTVLRWSLAVVILVEALLFLFSSVGRHEFASTHLPNGIRLFLGITELAGAILLMLPRMVAAGGWLLMFSFLGAIVIHLLHGMPNVGSLVIYAAAAWTVASSNGK